MNANGYIPIRLTTTEQYLRLLDRLEASTAYISLVDVFHDRFVIPKACEVMRVIETRQASEWLGTQCGEGYSCPQYLFHSDPRFFQFLRTFPSFFSNTTDIADDESERVIETGFGWVDIAFYDKYMHPLFFTTTHEGYADAHPSILY